MSDKTNKQCGYELNYPMDLRSYLTVYEGFLSKKECSDLIKVMKNADWRSHSYYDPKTAQQYNGEKELSVVWHRDPKTMALQERIWEVINTYITKENAWMGKWFGGWQGYSPVRFNKYNVDTRMEKHCDHIHSIFDGERKGIPVLSVLGALNDNYEGGDLLFWDDQKIELKAGAIMVFPSNFMYPHRVSEVTKGTRYSYVSWVW